MRRAAWGLAFACACACGAAWAEPAPAPAVPAGAEVAPAGAVGIAADAVTAPATRSGREIYDRFVEGLADRNCPPDASARWRQHFAHAPRTLTRNDDVMPLFGYVVDALRESHLPTEFALIPFVESGYRPEARSASGPAGLWQFIALTARNHKVPIRPGYDGRLSPVDSTTAAVRYLKTLHGMFAGDWRLAVMAFNAGEYRVLGALKRSGQRPMDADHTLLEMPEISQAYVRKLHALSCLLTEAGARESFVQALERPVPVLAPVPVPAGVDTLDAWASRHSVDPAALRRLNPAFPAGRVTRGDRGLRVLAPRADATAFAVAAPPAAGPPVDRGFTAMAAPEPVATPATPRRTHTVARGESAWTIAKRHGLAPSRLLALNSLDGGSVLKPGMVLQLDEAP